MENILESRIEFKNNKLFRITVLVEFSKGDVRAIYADTKQNLSNSDNLSAGLHIPAC